jgi:hypothetical protein
MFAVYPVTGILTTTFRECLRQQLIGIWFFAAPPVIDAARVRENWFLVSLIMAA